MTIHPTDADLVGSCDVILSVVPPRDAAETAQRVIGALSSSSPARPSPLYFADMNAVAPSTARQLAAMFDAARVPVRFVDGCIIGGPPSLKEGGTDAASSQDGGWDVPLMPASGPHKLADAGVYGPALAAALRMKHISADVGAASGLKMCFASMSKGYTAIALQAYTSAQRMGVLAELQETLAVMAPARAAQTEKGLVAMAPKAYRWVREMEEISKTHAEEGGFEPFLFLGAAGVYRAVADDTVLGQEKVGKRKRGTTAEDIAKAMSEGLEQKKSKTQ